MVFYALLSRLGKVKVNFTLLSLLQAFDKNTEKWAYVLQADLYNKLSQSEATNGSSAGSEGGNTGGGGGGDDSPIDDD